MNDKIDNLDLINILKLNRTSGTINSLKSDFTKFLFFIFKDLLKNITSIYTTFSKNKFAGSVFKDHISWSVKDIFGKDNDINTRTKHFKNLLYNTSIGKLITGLLLQAKGNNSTGSTNGASNSGSSGTSGTGTSVWDMKPNLTISDIEQKGSNGFKSEYIKKINNIAKSFLGSSGLLEIIKDLIQLIIDSIQNTNIALITTKSVSLATKLASCIKSIITNKYWYYDGEYTEENN